MIGPPRLSMVMVAFGVGLAAMAACGDIQVNDAQSDATGCTPYCIGQQAYGCNEAGQGVAGQVCGGGTVCQQGVCLKVDGDVVADALPETSSDVEAEAEATNDTVPDVAPDVGPDTEADADVAPDTPTEPDAVPDVGPDVEPDVGPDVESDADAGPDVVCTPDCDGKECGPDGCGGSCGSCTGGKQCQFDTCICTPKASSKCFQGDVYWFDACGFAGELKQDCEFGCLGGICLSCEPDCAGLACGNDGCGGSCGSCPSDQVCDAGACVCEAGASLGCADGDVWSYDSCGNAEAEVEACGYGCTDGVCNVCTPNCSGKECGGDGCGGSCGGCPSDQTCQGGTCACTSGASVACNGGNVWSYDSCGNAESQVEACQYGCTGGACDACTPSCGGKQCGGDGCGGSCGSCGGCDACSGGQCQSTCAADEVCTGGACKVVDGGSCSSGGQCQSGYCNSGLCCDGGTCCDADSDCPYGPAQLDAQQPAVPASGGDDFAVGLVAKNSTRSAQSFKPIESGVLDKVDLRLTAVDASSSLTARVSIRTALPPGGTELAAVDISVATGTADYQWYTADFGGDPAVTAGATYWVVIADKNFPPPCGQLCFTWVVVQGKANNPYAGGQWFISSDAGATWQANASSTNPDMTFKTYVRTRACANNQCQ